MAEQLVLRGTLEGHSGWVTSLATSLEKCVYGNVDGGGSGMTAALRKSTDMRSAPTCSSPARATRL